MAVEKLQARYEKLYQRNQPSRDAAEMARLAEQLGRRFEAEVFLTVAIAVDTDRDDLRSDLSRLKLHAETRDQLLAVSRGARSPARAVNWRLMGRLPVLLESVTPTKRAVRRYS